MFGFLFRTFCFTSFFATTNRDVQIVTRFCRAQRLSPTHSFSTAFTVRSHVGLAVLRYHVRTSRYVPETTTVSPFQDGLEFILKILPEASPAFAYELPYLFLLLFLLLPLATICRSIATNIAPFDYKSHSYTLEPHYK